MADKLDRFSRLEIPEDRRIDWNFLDTELVLPRPLPTEGEPIVAWVNGHVLRPTEHSADEGHRIVLFDQWRGLEVLPSPSDLEGDWHERHARLLERQSKRFENSIPTEVMRDGSAIAEALDLLRTAEPSVDGLLDADKALPADADDHLAPRQDDSVLSTMLVGHGRMLRLHDKLYDLVTLREYTRIFERAIEPTCFGKLAAIPLDAPPAHYLSIIEENIDDIHAKARSPLRNKMATSRVVINGITLLPIYVDQADGLIDTYAELIEGRLKQRVLTSHE